ncbi:large-conductance mechanosensitive channel protein MscL [Nibrella saemangeumensis]|uniref:Large-conductance mechanosensitive channel n=1 Tax=Nibrella saemangeumensis TaxID=1084526 RepID=A0ABP8NRG1_9BACT
MLKEFKTFIAQGNVLDLAVGVIIGAAFGKIVNSLVEDIINPILGLFLGGVDLSNLRVILKDAVGETPEVAIRYGNFLNTALQFMIIAFIIFLIVKAANHIRRKPEEVVVVGERV